MTGDRFVTIKGVGDAVEAEMLVDLLAQEGIVASTPGVGQAAHLGNIATAVVETPLRVRESDAERAREILSALDEYDEIVPEDVRAPDMDPREGPYRGGQLEDEKPPRKKVTAVAAAIIMPMILGIFGAGHFYVRRYGRGFLLLFAAWLGIGASMLFDPVILLALPVVVAGDIWGALRAIGQEALAAR